jgi:hypothetical protein
MRIAVAGLVAALVSLAAGLAPPGGRVISGWGGIEDLAAYSKAVAPHAPALISFEVGPDFGLVSDFLNHYREFAAAHGFFVAMVGLNFRGHEEDVATGMRDPDVYVIADGLRDVRMPVLLSIGRDFNDPGAAYATSGYIGAFRHTTEVFHREIPDFAAVWEATARGFSDPHYMKWYPGDDVVDWWGIDFVDADFDGAENFMDEAARHRKPILICAGPGAVKSEGEALKWYTAFFDFIRRHPAIGAFALRPPARLARWPKVAAYLKQQLADPRFIGAREASAIFRPMNPAQ